VSSAVVRDVSLKDVVPLVEARDTAAFGPKAVGLGDSVRSGLPVPPGVALSGPVVEAVATGDEVAIRYVTKTVSALAPPLAVRSSAADEDGASASFAGQHMTLLNVASVGDLVPALCKIWWSANSDAAISYRKRVGLYTRPSVGVVVQSLLDPAVAGVLFTRNPLTGADEQVVEASWGLGEAVVAGLVIPDHFRVARNGNLLERTAGHKQVVVRPLPDGGTAEVPVSRELVGTLCLDDDQLLQLHALGMRCEEVFGPGRDIEWAFAGDKGRDLYLLQCRAVTTTAGAPRRATGKSVGPDRSGSLRPVPLFAELTEEERVQVARLFKERRFSAGETVVREGTAGAAFFVIDEGEATVLVGGEKRATLGPGDYFGEIALIDEGSRMATVTATSDLVCQGITLWDFRPLVEHNGPLAWKLLQATVKKLREAQAPEPRTSRT
jgi:pyruvate,water dikinase